MIFFSQPSIIFISFLCLGALFFILIKNFAADGREYPGKREPYACGEEFIPGNIRLTYHAFFRTALVFGILHIVAMVITTMPEGVPNRFLVAIYLVSAVATIVILLEKDEIYE